MSDQNPSPVSGSVLVVVLGVVACFILSAIVVVLVAVPEGGNPGSIVAVLFGSLATVIGSIVGLAQINKIAKKVDDLTNGKMDAKIRAGVADVVKDEHLDPDAAKQIEKDREKRDG